MKNYSNPSRKPMMYGGMAKPTKKMSTTDASTAKSYTPNDKKMYGGKAKK